MILRSLIAIIVLSASCISESKSEIPAKTSPENSVEEFIIQQIKNKYPEAEINLLDARAPKNWDKSDFLNWNVTQFYETNPGKAEIVLQKQAQTITVKTYFQAFKNILHAQGRIPPKTVLNRNLFSVKRVDISQPPYREMRAALVSSNYPVPAIEQKDQTQSLWNGKFETTHTYLPQQPLLSTHIVKRPDVKRGDWMKLELIAGAVKLSSFAEILEPANINDSVRIKIKGHTQETVAKVKSDLTLEIQL